MPGTSGFGRRLQRWARRRQGPDGDFTELTQRRVYILPTRSGLVFGLVLFTMLLGALNYSNNMGFALAFLLTAVVVVSIHHCQRNLAGLRLSVSGCTPVFAGEPLECQVHIANPGLSHRWQVVAGPTVEPATAADLPAGQAVSLPLRLDTRQRGLMACPGIRISTRHPLGLFEAWSWLYPDRELLVYPRPAPAGQPARPAADAEPADSGETRQGSEEFVGLRRPLPGESPARMAWKAWARTGQLLAKDFRSGGGALWLDWAALSEPDAEERLSQLTRMLLDAEAAGRSYGLRLPGCEIGPGAGPEQRHRCLAALATFDPRSTASGG